MMEELTIPPLETSLGTYMVATAVCIMSKMAIKSRYFVKLRDYYDNLAKIISEYDSKYLVLERKYFWHGIRLNKRFLEKIGYEINPNKQEGEWGGKYCFWEDRSTVKGSFDICLPTNELSTSSFFSVRELETQVKRVYEICMLKLEYAPSRIPAIGEILFELLDTETIINF